MADYSVAPANVLASAHAKRFQMPGFTLQGDSVPVPNQCIAGATITAGMPVFQGTDDLFYPADATPLAPATSGSLVVGKRYVITTYAASDDFTNVGAASNATGVVFKATGTTPTTWSNGSTVSEEDATYKAVGIAENSASPGQVVGVVTEDPFFKPGCTLAIGDIPVVSGLNSGGLGKSTDMTTNWYVSPLGVAYSTTHMVLKPCRSDAARL